MYIRLDEFAILLRVRPGELLNAVHTKGEHASRHERVGGDDVCAER